MGSWLLLAFGVCCALLCHWMIRHTYVDYEWVEYGEKDILGNRKKKKEWNEKLQLPRLVYVFLWAFCIGLFPVAVAAPIVVGFFLTMKVHDNEYKFIHNNKIISWFTKKV